MNNIKYSRLEICLFEYNYLSYHKNILVINQHELFIVKFFVLIKNSGGGGTCLTMIKQKIIYVFMIG